MKKTAILTAFHGNQLNNVWKPLTFEMHPIDVNEKIGDFVQLQGCIGCSEEAKNYILELTSGSIEFLPVFYQDTILYALNVVEVIDCLDEKKSEIEYFPNAGRIRVIKRYELKSELLSGKHIFKIPQRIMGTIYVSDDFKNLIEQNRLSGLTFYKKWEG